MTDFPSSNPNNLLAEALRIIQQRAISAIASLREGALKVPPGTLRDTYESFADTVHFFAEEARIALDRPASMCQHHMEKTVTTNINMAHICEECARVRYESYGTAQAQRPGSLP